MPRHKIPSGVTKSKRDPSSIKNVRAFRANDDEFSIINKKAADLGLTFSQYVLFCSLDKNVTYKVDLLAINHLRRIGVNINQISHQIKIKPELYQARDILPTLEELHSLLSDLISKLK